MMNGTKLVRFPYSPDYSYFFGFEETFDRDSTRVWMKANWSLSLLVGVMYIFGAFALQNFMKTRQAWKLNGVLIFWNWTLAVFSIIGFIRTVPEFFYVLTRYGYHFSVCNRSYADINVITAFWGFLFSVSKVPELLDTAFVILRKRNLIFLHWFHHFLTLVLSWYIYSDHPAMGRWIMVMNYAVHSVMYSYYALRAMSFRPPKWISMMVTTIQILQMMLGLVASVYSTVMLVTGRKCGLSNDVAAFLLFVYSSYFLLFVNFFLKAYVTDHATLKKVTRKSATNGYTTLYEDSKPNGHTCLARTLLNGKTPTKLD